MEIFTVMRIVEAAAVEMARLKYVRRVCGIAGGGRQQGVGAGESDRTRSPQDRDRLAG